jgi:lipoprotein NlpI
LASIAAVNHPARLHNAAMLLFSCTAMTALGQAEKPADTFAREEAGYSAKLKSKPDNANLYNQRGVARFFQLKFDESLADFDKFIEMRPNREPYHWQRGIVHYYAGKHKAGRRQFELHQTVNTQDVENAVWHYLCVSKIDGVKAAQKLFIKITSDLRVPLKETHALFAGKGTEQQVLDAIKSGDPTPTALTRNQFYGHLYLGLYFEAQGNAEKAADYITKAAKGHEAHGYMGQVARVHHEWLQKKAKQKTEKAK